MKSIKQFGLFTVATVLILIGVNAHKTAATNVCNENLTLANIEAVTKLIGDLECPSIYDRPYSSMAIETNNITVGCTVKGSLSYGGASLTGNFEIGRNYYGTYTRKWCKDDDKRLVCCKTEEQGAWLTNMEAQ